MMFDYRSFPLLGWLSRHVKIRSADGPDNIYGDCPFCGEPGTFAASKLQCVFRCFRCKEGGHCTEIWSGSCGLIKMYQLLEKTSYADAKIQVSRLCGTSFIQHPKAPVPQVASVPNKIWPDGSLSLSRCSESNHGTQMLIRRGVSHLIEKSMYAISGTYADRVLLPAHWFGEVQGFEAKAVYKQQKPKALYPNWFRTGDRLYSTYNWDWSKNFAVITESILDAETFGANAIGLYGSNLKEGQFALLLELRKKGVSSLVWVLDSDALRKAVKMILEKAGLFFTNYLVVLPEGEDPNSLGQEKSWGLVSTATQVANEDDALPFLLQYF